MLKFDFRHFNDQQALCQITVNKSVTIFMSFIEGKILLSGEWMKSHVSDAWLTKN